MFPFSICLVHIERHFLLPSIPTGGHGLVLLLFWTLVFINENLTFINMKHSDWWFNLTNSKDKIEMAIFATRYFCCLLIFVIGLKAPGISSGYSEYATNLLNENDNENRSTWANAWHKITTLAPFLWPRRSILLQFRIVFCFMLLITGRVVNLYVPIYNKKIGRFFLSVKMFTNILNFIFFSFQLIV